MAPARLSQLQRQILTWLLAEDRRTRGTMAAEHRALVRVLRHDKGNLSHSLRKPRRQGLGAADPDAGG